MAQDARRATCSKCGADYGWHERDHADLCDGCAWIVRRKAEDGGVKITIEQAAERLGMHPASVRKAIQLGRLTVAERVGKRLILLDAAEVEWYCTTPRDKGGRPPKVSEGR